MYEIFSRTFIPDELLGRANVSNCGEIFVWGEIVGEMFSQQMSWEWSEKTVCALTMRVSVKLNIS